MEKILKIDGKDVKLKSTGAYLLRYKAQFKRDAIQDIFRLADAIDIDTGTVADLSALDLEVFYNLVWVLAKTADSNIPPPLEWLDSFSEFPLMEILPEITDMVYSCLRPSVDSKKK